jgi:hypothetical protein
VLETLRRCKLYDYEARRWTDFDGVSTTPALAERTEAQSGSQGIEFAPTAARTPT